MSTQDVAKKWAEMCRKGENLECIEQLSADNVTFKEKGRIQMEEVGVFEVKDGKIINEQFFYDM
jgi:limonene-1,2-epoxide hydrolase